MNNNLYISTILGMDSDIFLIIVVSLGVLAVAGFIFYLSSVFVDKNHIKIIERLGKYRKTVKQGWHFIIPVLDKIVIDLENECRIFDSKKELAILGSEHKAFRISYSFSYTLIDPKSFYYLTTCDAENIEFISNQIVLEFFNNLSLKNVKSVYDQNDEKLIHFINNRLSKYGMKIDEFVIRSAVAL